MPISTTALHCTRNAASVCENGGGKGRKGESRERNNSSARELRKQEWNNGELSNWSLAAQLLKKQTNRFNPTIKVGNMKLLIRRVQIVVRQAEAHHHARNL